MSYRQLFLYFTFSSVIALNIQLKEISVAIYHALFIYLTKCGNFQLSLSDLLSKVYEFKHGYIDRLQSFYEYHWWINLSSHSKIWTAPIWVNGRLHVFGNEFWVDSEKSTIFTVFEFYIFCLDSGVFYFVFSLDKIHFLWSKYISLGMKFLRNICINIQDLHF